MKNYSGEKNEITVVEKNTTGVIKFRVGWDAPPLSKKVNQKTIGTCPENNRKMIGKCLEGDRKMYRKCAENVRKIVFLLVSSRCS